MAACSREKEIIIDPVMNLDRSSVLTTEQLNIQLILNPDMEIPESDYLIRWDWEGDSTFDAPYSKSLQVSHVYPEPGEYELTAEILDLNEITYQTSQHISVQQGYSKPIPSFVFTPESGNPKTIYHFNASQTQDAEEEIEWLTFNWDFTNDQSNEFRLKGNPEVDFQFPETGDFKVRLVVTDTSGLSAETYRIVPVTGIDTLIIPVVSYYPEYPTDRDTIQFDASKSYYFGNPEIPLTYSFKPHNGSWTEPSDTGLYNWDRPLTGVNTLLVKVISPENYYQLAKIEVQVTTGDQPPKAFFKRSSRFGNTQGLFFFDAWGSSDKEDMPSELQVKWDFNGDGSWDTNYSSEKYISWRFIESGIYQVKMRVLDSKGGFDEAEMDVHVSNFANLTSYVYDERSATYYGTVKIGNQWWMGENLRYNPNHDTIPGKFLTWCYDDNPTVCKATGKLYSASQVLSSWNNEWPDDHICPRGWSLPSASDWRTLFDYYGIESAGKELYYAGKSDFNALYGGYAGYHAYGPFVDFEMDSVYKTAVFMSSTIEMGKLRVFQLKRDSARAEERPMVISGYYSIRCIKDDE